MTENIGNILFVVAGTLWGIELLPQLWKTFRTKSAKDFSPVFLSLCIIAYLLFMVGCILKKEWILFVGHIFPVINLIILCVLYRLYGKKKYETCTNNGEHICNKGYACDACPHNKDTK